KSHTDDWAPGPFSSKPQRSQLQIFSSVLQTSLLFLLMEFLVESGSQTHLFWSRISKVLSRASEALESGNPS
ncbi:LY9 isoform 7, partial [Pan troglodytes]